MRVRSTGLGKTEMVAQIERLEPVANGYLIMAMHSTEPVHWRIRIALTGQDLRRLVWLALGKPSVLMRIIQCLLKGVNKKLPPEF
jgi:hypothetical protein